MQYQHNNHEYVDLGLPSGILWATCNIGANSPEEFGNYFAWGEITPKHSYSWDTYKFGSCFNELNKYNTQNEYGKVDNITTLNIEDDAANANWGHGWRMPTATEFAELRKVCTWEWGKMNGIQGYYVIGPNQNYIFLPAAGWYDDAGVQDAVMRGNYWASSIDTFSPFNAYCLLFFSNGWNHDGGWGRLHGRSIRPVLSFQK